MPTIIKSDPKAREKPCLRCGYSLRKLTDSTRCPECGLSVWLSLNQNDTLEMSNPQWLRTMAKGAMVMIAGLLLAGAAYTLYAMRELPMIQYRMRLEQAMANYDPDDDASAARYAAAIRAIPAPTQRATLVIGAIAAGAGFLLVYHAGLFWLTLHEGRYPDRLGDWRVAARVVCAAAAGLSLLMLIWLTSPYRLMFFGYLLKLVAIASAVVTWGYLRRLARRAPQTTLAKCCTFLMFAPLISLLKVVPFCAVYLVAQFSWVADLLPIVYIPVSIGLLVWFARIFAQAATAADKNWATETALTR